MTSRSSSRVRATSAIGGIVAVGLLLAACGSSKKAAETTAAATTAAPTTAAAATTAAPTTAAAATTAAPTTAAADTTAAPATDAPTTTAAADPLGTPNKATGDPIVVGTINEAGSGAIDTQSANTLKGIKMAAAYLNDYRGGIAGHPITIVDCGNKATPAGATDCANQMVEKKINLYTEPYSGQEAVIVKILTAAGIPMVNGSSSSQEGLTLPGAFATTGGYPATLGAFAIDAKAQGVKKFAMLTVDVPAATGAAQALGGMVFKKEGVDYSVVPIPLGTADITPMLQSAITDGADAVAITGDASLCSTFLQGYKTLGLDVKKYVISTCIDPKVIDAAGDVLKGSRVAVTRAKSDDDALFAAIVGKYGEAGDSTDPATAGGVVDGWASLMNAAAIFKDYKGPIDPASLLAEIKKAKDVPMILSGGLTFTCDGSALAILPNVCSSQVQMGVLDEKGGVSDLTKVDAAEAFKP